MKVPGISDGQGTTAAPPDKVPHVELISVTGEEKPSVRRYDVNGYVSEDSEPDLVDLNEIRPHSGEYSSSQNPEISVNTVSAKSCDVTSSTIVRSSLKLPSSSGAPMRDKRTISFDLHNRKLSQPEPEVTIQQSNNVQLRNLFAKSRWSASSTETDSSTPRLGEKDPVLVHLNDVTMSNTKRHSGDTVLTNDALRAAAVKKSYSLQPNFRRKRSTEDAQKKRRSTGDDVIGHNASLRDSAIDLVSDEENSEVYTAVSLAGTLSRNMQPVPAQNYPKKYVIVGVTAGFVVAAIIIVTLLAILLTKQ